MAEELSNEEFRRMCRYLIEQKHIVAGKKVNLKLAQTEEYLNLDLRGKTFTHYQAFGRDPRQKALARQRIVEGMLYEDEPEETFPPKGYEINYDHLKTSPGHIVLDDPEFEYWRHIVAEENRRNMTVSERPNPCPINPIKEMYIDQCIKMSKIPTKRGYRQFRELRGI
jgi:hypothetical protein